MNPRERSELADRVARARIVREAENRLEEQRARFTNAPTQISPPRVRAQTRLLEDPSRSDRAIASTASTTHVTVASVRRELEAAGILDVVTTRVDLRGTVTCWALRLAS